MFCVLYKPEVMGVVWTEALCQRVFEYRRGFENLVHVCKAVEMRRRQNKSAHLHV